MTIPFTPTTITKTKRHFLQVAASLLLAMTLLAGEARGDVIYLKSGRTVFGLYESEIDGNVHFRERMEQPGVYEPRVFLRTDIRALVVTVNPERLSALQPGDWIPWRDLAEELAIQSVDPEARDLALRLYLILARNASEPLKTVAFRGAIGVAAHHPSREAERQIRVLAWLESGGTSEAPETRMTGQSPPSSSNDQRQQCEQLALAIRNFRQGDRSMLIRLIRDVNFPAILAPFASVCTSSEFEKIGSRESPDFGEMSTLIRLELAALALSEGEAPPRVDRDGTWSVLVAQNRPAPALADFLEIAGIDPLAVHYRSGAWYRPD